MWWKWRATLIFVTGASAAGGCYSAGDDDDDPGVNSGGSGGSGGSGNAPASGGSANTSGGAGEGGDGATGSGGEGATSGSGASGGSAGSGGQGAGECGDGAVGAGEACDDGNQDDGDGCSAGCTVEAGHTCTAATCEPFEGGCAWRVPVTFRDFNASGSVGGHPDFEPPTNNADAITGLVEPLLDEEGKPKLSTLGLSGSGFLHGQEAFAQWYRDAAPVNATIQGEMVLYPNEAGDLVNRWGLNGGQYLWTAYENVFYGGYAGDGCTSCTPATGEQCLDPCTAPLYGETYSCCALVVDYAFDGNPLFFPIDPPTAGILEDARGPGMIPPEYGVTTWTPEATVAEQLGVVQAIQTELGTFPSSTHNFHFTTELVVNFRYDESQQLTVQFTGDDDVWVFINGQLAIDLGGWHTPLAGYVDIFQNTAADYGMVHGGVYTLSIFHAERQTDGSTFQLMLRGFDLGSSVCVPDP